MEIFAIHWQESEQTDRWSWRSVASLSKIWAEFFLILTICLWISIFPRDITWDSTWELYFSTRSSSNHWISAADCLVLRSGRPSAALASSYSSASTSYSPDLEVFDSSLDLVLLPRLSHFFNLLHSHTRIAQWGWSRTLGCPSQSLSDCIYSWDKISFLSFSAGWILMSSIWYEIVC